MSRQTFFNCQSGLLKLSKKLLTQTLCLGLISVMPSLSEPLQRGCNALNLTTRQTPIGQTLTGGFEASSMMMMIKLHVLDGSPPQPLACKLFR